MTKPFKWTSSLCTAALFAAAACQLNDLDSAPRAPDLADDTESSADPAQVGPGSSGRAPTQRDAGSAADAGRAGDTTTPPSPLAGDAALDAAPTPSFPILPSLEAGSLPPAI